MPHGQHAARRWCHCSAMGAERQHLAGCAHEFLRVISTVVLDLQWVIQLHTVQHAACSIVQ